MKGSHSQLVSGPARLVRLRKIAPVQQRRLTDPAHWLAAAELSEELGSYSTDICYCCLPAALCHARVL